MGRLVHFDPFQTAALSTQFFNSLSSVGIRSKFGQMNFGGALAIVVAFWMLMLRSPGARVRVATPADLIADKERDARAWLWAALRPVSASDQASARRFLIRLPLHPA